MGVQFSDVCGPQKGQPYKTVAAQFDIPGEGYIKDVPIDDPDRHQRKNEQKKKQRYGLFEFVIDFY